MTRVRLHRRDFIAWLGAAAWALPAVAQPAMPVIGYLGSESPEPFASADRRVPQGLAEAGYAEGRNVAIEFRWAEGQYGRLPELAEELVKRAVDRDRGPRRRRDGARGKAATATIPIVFEMGGDPVALGVVGSIGRPGGNLTGVSSLSVELSRKRLEILRELVPEATRVRGAEQPGQPHRNGAIGNLRPAAEASEWSCTSCTAGTEQELEAACSPPGAAARRRPRVHLRSVLRQPQPAPRRARGPLCACPPSPSRATSRSAGGLMSYGGNFTQSHHLTGIYIGRMLKGEKPAELPVQQVTKVELFLNLKAAGALGLALPASILGRADVVVD